MSTEKKEDIKPISKYTIVPVFWHEPTEVAAMDIVASYDNTGKVYLNFIDEDGRLWKGGLEEFVIIKNLPTQEDIEDFQRLKKESEDSRKDIVKKRADLEKQKKQRENEVS